MTSSSWRIWISVSATIRRFWSDSRIRIPAWQLPLAATICCSIGWAAPWTSIWSRFYASSASSSTASASLSSSKCQIRAIFARFPWYFTWSRCVSSTPSSCSCRFLFYYCPPPNSTSSRSIRYVFLEYWNHTKFLKSTILTKTVSYTVNCSYSGLGLGLKI